MLIGMVVTVSGDWYRNVLTGISNGGTQIDYWTNGWLPNKDKDIRRLEVYYDGALILEGKVVEMYKATPVEVFANFSNNRYAIGLEPKNSINDFMTMLNSAFIGPCGDEIGNIIFEVDCISPIIFDSLKNKGVSIPQEIKKGLFRQEVNLTQGKIAYK